MWLHRFHDLQVRRLSGQSETGLFKRGLQSNGHKCEYYFTGRHDGIDGGLREHHVRIRCSKRFDSKCDSECQLMHPKWNGKPRHTNMDNYK